jgi:hypothetical protein
MGYQIRILVIFIFMLIGIQSHAQKIDEDFTYHRKNRWSPSLIHWHEFYPSFTVATDLDFKWNQELTPDLQMGNIMVGMNIGLGAGYRFKLGLDDLPQATGIGVRAAFYPGTFMKYALTFDTKLLVLGNDSIYGGVISGGEFNVSYHLPSNLYEARSSLILVEARYKQWEFLWALQSYSDFIFKNRFIDGAFSVYSLNYILKI